MVEKEHATTFVCVRERERAIGLERVNPIMRSYHPLTHRNSIKVRKSFPDCVVSFNGLDIFVVSESLPKSIGLRSLPLKVNPKIERESGAERAVLIVWGERIEYPPISFKIGALPRRRTERFSIEFHNDEYGCDERTRAHGVSVTLPTIVFPPLHATLGSKQQGEPFERARTRHAVASLSHFWRTSVGKRAWDEAAVVVVVVVVVLRFWRTRAQWEQSCRRRRLIVTIHHQNRAVVVY
jgi:hypothetical protein